MRRTLGIVTLALTVLAVRARASNIYIGNDTQTPVTVYTSSGTFVENFGQDRATGTGINAAGDIWTVAPNFGDNSIVEYTPSQVVLNSFIEGADGQWVEDMSHGVGSNLYLSTYEGNLLTVDDTTGAILSSFAVANSSFTGVAFDGLTGDLWLSGGLTSDNLFEYTTGGTLLDTIPLSATCGGVGYDISDNTLWCGDYGQVYHYSITGSLLGSFATSSGAYHDGLETVNLPSTAAEPGTATLLLILLGLGAVIFGVSERRRLVC